MVVTVAHDQGSDLRRDGLTIAQFEIHTVNISSFNRDKILSFKYIKTMLVRYGKEIVRLTFRQYKSESSFRFKQFFNRLHQLEKSQRGLGMASLVFTVLVTFVGMDKEWRIRQNQVITTTESKSTDVGMIGKQSVAPLRGVEVIGGFLC